MNNEMDYCDKRYNLGPNGGILTALNLFTTKFDQVLELVEKRAETVEYVLVILILYSLLQSHVVTSFLTHQVRSRFSPGQHLVPLSRMPLLPHFLLWWHTSLTPRGRLLPRHSCPSCSMSAGEHCFLHRVSNP